MIRRDLGLLGLSVNKDIAVFRFVYACELLIRNNAVGDSPGMCVYGYSSTVPVTMDQCIAH